MSLRAWYKFDDTDLTIDSQNNANLNANVGVTSISETFNGNSFDVAYFDGSSYLNMVSTNVTNNLSTILFTSSRTFSGWLKPGSSNGVVHANGDNNTSKRFRNSYNPTGFLNLDFKGSTLSGNTAPVPGTWFHFATTFNGTSKLVSQYVNGVLVNSGTFTALSTNNGAFSIGRDPTTSSSEFLGSMSDFRIYNSDLNATAIGTLFTNGPLDLGLLVPDMIVTMYSHAAEISWPEVSGATSYTLRMSEAGGDFVTISETTGLTHTELNLNDGSLFDFELYSDLDLVTPAYTSTGNSTPSADETETGNLLSLLSNDISELTTDNVQEINEFISGNLTQGDELVGRISFNNEGISTNTMTFVSDEGTISSDTTNILTPFIPGGTDTEKQINLTLSDSTTENITFDETTSTMDVNGTTYNIGDSFIIDGKIAKISEIN